MRTLRAVSFLIAGLTLITPTSPGAATAHEGTRRAGARVAAGGYHTCAVRSGGTVQCWGDNDAGQLGDGSTLDRSTAVQVVDLTDVIAVTAGTTHTCALTASGSVYCWGSNAFGQLGKPVSPSTTRPELVAGLSGVANIAAGGNHTCAALATGEARCWGLNSSGQLGDGTLTQRTSPVAVVTPGGTALTGVIEVSGGFSFSCALTAGGLVHCWGNNVNGQTGVSPTSGTTVLEATQVPSISGAVLLGTGAFHACAVVATREVKCWGLNLSGQLGNGTNVDSYTPVTVTAGNANMSGLYVGNRHTCLRRANAVIQCWGLNSTGQLGDGTIVSRNTPAAAVTGVSTAAALTSGGNGIHTCALLGDDQVKCWGYNARGQLGDGTLVDRTTPVLALAAGGSTTARTISNGALHTCAVRANGAADCWGDNADGQLGDGTNVGRTTPNAGLPVSGLSNVSQIGAGNRFTCAQLAGGTLQCWGSNAAGQLGNGTNVNSLIPVTVAAGFGAIALAVGDGHACAVKGNGRVGCWGSNASGQLGDGTTANRNAPVTVSGLTEVAMLAAGLSHTCALRAGGTVQCWGANSYGQLGDGTTTQRLTPVTVAGIANAVSISAGQYHTCAVLAGGALQCWGANFEGQLGDGTTTDRLSPVAASGVTNAVAVTANGEFSCALLADGTAKCWGDNFHGQLGDGTTTDRLTPTAVSSLTGILSLGATSDNLANMSNCALQVSGRPYCWGNNTAGKLGDGTTTSRSTPTAVLTF